MHPLANLSLHDHKANSMNRSPQQPGALNGHSAITRFYVACLANVTILDQPKSNEIEHDAAII